MRDLRESCRIAVVQAAPVMFDKAACTVKAVELIRAAAAERAELIVFPELFIPGYPYGMTFGFTVGSRTAPGRKDWGLYYDNSILVPGPETEILGRAAREARAYVSIGVSERDAVNATLYNTNLIFSPAGELLTVHRKLKPTGAERVAWGDADISAIKRLAEMGFKVTVTGGLALEDLPLFKGIPIHVFIAGRSIRDAASPVEAARQFKRSIAELWG